MKLTSLPKSIYDAAYRFRAAIRAPLAEYSALEHAILDWAKVEIDKAVADALYHERQAVMRKAAGFSDQAAQSERRHA